MLLCCERANLNRCGCAGTVDKPRTNGMGGDNSCHHRKTPLHKALSIFPCFFIVWRAIAWDLNFRNRVGNLVRRQQVNWPFSRSPRNNVNRANHLLVYLGWGYSWSLGKVVLPSRQDKTANGKRTGSFGKEIENCIFRTCRPQRLRWLRVKFHSVPNTVTPGVLPLETISPVTSLAANSSHLKRS